MGLRTPTQSAGGDNPSGLVEPAPATLKSTSLAQPDTQSESLTLNTEAATIVNFYYTTSGDSTFTVELSVSGNNYRPYKTFDTSSADTPQEAVEILPNIVYRFVRVTFSAPSDRNVTLELVAGGF